MAPLPKFHVRFGSRTDALMQRALGSMSVFTMLMTLPQVGAIWIGHQAGGVPSPPGARISCPPSCGSSMA